MSRKGFLSWSVTHSFINTDFLEKKSLSSGDNQGGTILIFRISRGGLCKSLKVLWIV